MSQGERGRGAEGTRPARERKCPWPAAVWYLSGTLVPALVTDGGSWAQQYKSIPFGWRGRERSKPDAGTWHGFPKELGPGDMETWRWLRRNGWRYVDPRWPSSSQTIRRLSQVHIDATPCCRRRRRLLLLYSFPLSFSLANRGIVDWTFEGSATSSQPSSQGRAIPCESAHSSPLKRARSGKGRVTSMLGVSRPQAELVILRGEPPQRRGRPRICQACHTCAVPQRWESGGAAGAWGPAGGLLGPGREPPGRGLALSGSTGK